MVYRVVADDEIAIVALDPDDPKWYADHPFRGFPASWPRQPVSLEPLEERLLQLLAASEDGEVYLSSTSESDRAYLRSIGHPFPQVGGRQLMWQGTPVWDCGSVGCKVAHEVFAVIWERPAPGIHLWSEDQNDEDVGSCQIIFSMCRGCGAIHSCNRCD
jgi:hypothetical protein